MRLFLMMYLVGFVAELFAANVPIQETWTALEELVEARSGVVA